MPGFDEFWRLYPRKVGKAAAQRIYAGIVSANGKRIRDTIAGGMKVVTATEAEIERGVRHFVAGMPPDQDMNYVPHASTWLAQERFCDGEEEAGSEGAAALGQIWAQINRLEGIRRERDLSEAEETELAGLRREVSAANVVDIKAKSV